ncbi:MAG: GHMP kinase [Chloroflexota bacterium]|nr:MAG: GHMP kinase [Chloroflexota bacterium]
MLIRAKAPLRISFAGGGTDVPPFPQQEGGCVLSATINQFATGTLRPRADQNICIHSLDFGVSLTYRPEDQFIYDGKLDLVKAAILKMGCSDRGGYDLFLQSNAPPGSGLGSSSAMMVALVGLLKEFKQLPLTDYEVADLAYVIERKELGIQGGLQDHYAATFGGVNYIEFLADRVVVNSLKVPADVINELECNLLLCYTGTMRLSASIIDDQVGRYRRKDEETLDALREIKQLTDAMKSALLRRQLDQFGRLLHEEWEHKKKVSSKISNPDLDELYRVARREGALGGKITGAGGGGFMLLYCDFEKKHRVAERMKEMGCTITDLRLEPSGLQTWRVSGA